MSAAPESRLRQTRRLIASDDARTWLYVGIDMCLALGLSSLYLARRQGMGVCLAPRAWSVGVHTSRSSATSAG
ncbi:MAG TPA: hypothetical protein VHI99_17705 [Vicinamibacterales bacterium]|nr:hypothetical protein [Vicinamibacterales bacterium]